MTKRAAIYARYSSEQQDEATIETQLRECHDKAKALGAIVVSEYCDIAQSGRSDDRERFRQMLSDAKYKQFQLVIVRKFDRFARNVVDAGLTEQHLAKYGVKLVSCHEDFDTTTTAGWFGKQMIHLVNEWYSRNLAAETISGMETNARRGYRCGGTAPYGYRNIKVIDSTTGKTRTKLDRQEIEADAVKMIFQMYADGSSLGNIITALQTRRYMPRKAKNWSKSMISQILRNETYTGTIIWRKTPDPATWIRTADACPRLVSDTLWQQAKKRADAASKSSPRTRQTTHPLAGLVKCAECGGNYIIHNKQKDRWRLYCAKSIRKLCSNGTSIFEDVLIEQTRQAIRKELLDDERLLQAMQEFKKALGGDNTEKEKQLKKLRAQVDACTSKEVALVEELAGGDLPRDIVAKTLAKIKEDKTGLLARIADITKTLAPKCAITSADVREFSAIVRSRLDTVSPEVLKKQFNDFQLSVVISKKTAKITITPAIFDRGVVMLSAGSGRLNITPILSTALPLSVVRNRLRK